jgi:hypothetical protein
MAERRGRRKGGARSERAAGRVEDRVARTEPADGTEPEGGDPAARAVTPDVLERARRLRIALDGPAGSGKSSVARAVAERLGAVHLDTGAIYRAITLACLEADVDLADGHACAEVARTVRSSIEGGRTLDGRDVEDRDPRGRRLGERLDRVRARGGPRGRCSSTSGPSLPAERSSRDATSAPSSSRTPT